MGDSHFIGPLPLKKQLFSGFFQREYDSTLKMKFSTSETLRSPYLQKFSKHTDLHFINTMPGEDHRALMSRDQAFSTHRQDRKD